MLDTAAIFIDLFFGIKMYSTKSAGLRLAVVAAVGAVPISNEDIPSQWMQIAAVAALNAADDCDDPLSDVICCVAIAGQEATGTTLPAKIGGSNNSVM